MQSEPAGRAILAPFMIWVATTVDGYLSDNREPGAPTNIAPDWCMVDCIAIPYNGVDKLDEASRRYPHHEEACPNIPRY